MANFKPLCLVSENDYMRLPLMAESLLGHTEKVKRLLGAICKSVQFINAVSRVPVSQEIWTLGNLVAASKFPRKSGLSASKFPRKFGRS